MGAADAKRPGRLADADPHDLQLQSDDLAGVNNFGGCCHSLLGCRVDDDSLRPSFAKINCK